MFCKTPLLLALHATLPAAPPGPAACIEPDRLARDQGVDGDYSTEELTEHFRVAWDAENTAVDADSLQLYLDALEDSWTAEIDTLGWQAPDQTDSCPITVLLADLDEADSGTGGWTDVQTDGGVPFIILNTDWLADGEDWNKTLVAHEFNHASQFSYGVFWDETDWWYWESTAEWMPELVYPDANTYTWSLWEYLDSPWRPLDSMTGVSQYGHFVYNTWLGETYGEDTPRQVWDGATTRDHVENAVITVVGGEYDALIADYAGHMAAMDVAERDVWLEAIGYFDADPVSAHVETYPAEGGEDGRAAPQERGQNFIHLAGTPGDVRFEFSGATTAGDVATEWAVSLATDDGGGTFTHSSAITEGGRATLDIADVGGAVAEAWIAVTPLGAIDTEGATYTWTARAAKDVGGEGKGEEEEPQACGCAGVSASPLPVGLLLAALSTRRR